MRFEPQPFQTAALFLIVVGWLAIQLAGCGGQVVGPEDYCAGSPTAYDVDGPAQPGIAQIINGTPSTDRRGTVKVYSSRGSCTGTVIGPRTVLTAAHCVADAMSVHVDGTRFPTPECLVHPDYVIYPYDDLALLYTEEDLPGPYIELYDYALDSATCVEYIAQGYGRGSNGELHEKPYTVRHLGSRIMLTIGEDGSTCFGDSGGPLYAIDADGTPRLAGTVSTGHDLECYAGGHHVRVDYYADWIQENVR